MAFTVNLKIFSRLRNFEDLSELVGTEYLVSFAGSVSRRNVLDTFRRKNDRLTVRTRARVHVLIHEAFDVELSHHKLLSTLVKTNHSPIFVSFTFRVLRLRVINGAILNMKELTIQYQSVFALDFRKAR